ncbi:MAG TPA: M20 family metallopeptidase [Firmicutes bacterium]|jgi:amidohydrolase|nr:M20 family metallopeptidase [Bacillota bacterium]
MPANDALKNKVAGTVDALKDRLCSISDQMYREPEIGLQEVKSSKLLTNFLEEHGFDVETGLCEMPTSFRAIRKGKPGGPTVAILAEYDALPGLGHGCGHNIIGTAAAGAGAALAALMDNIQGNLVVLGSPAEEGAVDNAGGKVALVEGGVFENVDVAMMFHPSQSDVVISSSNARVAMEITFYGKSAHAAGAPHEGINALDAAILTFNNWNALRQHVKEDVRIHGVITKGGVAPNIIPDYAEIRMYVRAKDMDYLKEIEEKVRNCAEGAALATGAKVKFRHTARTYANMITNKTLAEVFAKNLEALGRKVSPPEPKAGGGSTDMGNVSQVVPSVHPYIAICKPGTATGHSKEFAEATISEMGHEALLDGAKALAMTAIDVFTQSGLLEAARKEFTEVVG